MTRPGTHLITVTSLFKIITVKHCACFSTPFSQQSTLTTYHHMTGEGGDCPVFFPATVGSIRSHILWACATPPDRCSNSMSSSACSSESGACHKSLHTTLLVMWHKMGASSAEFPSVPRSRPILVSIMSPDGPPDMSSSSCHVRGAQLP